MSAKFDEELPTQLHKISQDLANFMAVYEHADDKFKLQKEQIEQQLAVLKQENTGQIKEIRAALYDINEVMNAAGAARWRLSAEKALKEGEDHLLAIKEACNIYKKLAEDSVTRLEHISTATEKRVSSALYRLNDENSKVVEDFRHRSEEACSELESTTSSTIETIKRLLRWLRFDRIATALITGLVVAFLMSLYINAEWPWESFHQSAQEKKIGKTILEVWPTLPPEKQQLISALLGRKI